MEVRFPPILPPQAVRPVADARGFAQDPDRQPPVRDARRPEETPRPGGEPELQERRAADLAARRAEQAGFFQARVQPDLPATTRRALETFVQNSFSEGEDPASTLGGIDVFV